MNCQNESTQTIWSGEVIYDFGMNNGDDIIYYLKKGVKVVGVEANPTLIEECSARFSREIATGSLVLINCALSTETQAGDVTFYIHKYNHVLSQLPKPSTVAADHFTPISIQQRRPSDIIAEHGPPLYIKIDVEHYDLNILTDLFAHSVKPRFISAEAHSIEIFCALVLAGYRAFTLVDGHSVPAAYKSARINTADGFEVYSFPKHSAGPFGEDIQSTWLDAPSFMKRLAIEGFGWKDIHATSVVTPSTITGKYASQLSLPEIAHELWPSVARAFMRRLPWRKWEK